MSALRSKSTWSQARRIQAAAAVMAMSVLGGCQQILVTVPLLDDAGQTCKSAAGAYFLPKKVIAFTITQPAGNPAYSLNFVGTSPVADRMRAFCLDYLGSPLAEDTVHVNRENGLLTLISSVADDKTKDIAEKLIEVGVIAATGNPNFGFRSTKIKSGTDFILADYKFDPFDRQQLAEVNAALAPTYGYCVIVEDHTIDPDHYQAYCNNPRGTLRPASGRAPVYKAPPVVAELPPLEPDAGTTGILYRPNLTHQLITMRRRDPQSRNPWEVFRTTQLEMPNVAPVFSVGVERSMFVKRTTRLEFDAGVLRDITIEKPSELVEFMEIPLVLAQAIVKIPAEVVKLRLASTSNQKLLIDAQRDLLATQRDYFNTVKELQDKAAVAAAAGGQALPLRSAQIQSNIARALDQINPTRRQMIDALCGVNCPTCTLEVCRSIAETRCPGPELQACLPPILNQQ
jgi:hypothetical protein